MYDFSRSFYKSYTKYNLFNILLMLPSRLSMKDLFKVTVASIEHYILYDNQHSLVLNVSIACVLTSFYDFKAIINYIYRL